MKKRPSLRKSILYMLTALLVIGGVSFVAASIVIFAQQAGLSGRESRADAQPQENIRNSYYYNLLPAAQQSLYDAILSSVREYRDNTGTLLYAYDAKEYDAVVLALEADHPELFFLNFNAMTLDVSRGKSQVRLGYVASLDEMDEMRQGLSDAVAAAMAAVRASAAADGLAADAPLSSIGEFELEVELHDYLCASTVYYDAGEGAANGEEADAQTASAPEEIPWSLERHLAGTAYGALVQGRSLCDGYALAMKLLANEAGLSCDIVRGTADGSPHMWDIIYVNGKFYHLDPTYNDADIEFAPSLRFHGYFNLTAEAIKMDHTIDNERQLPVAQNDYDYYRAKNLHAENLMDLDRIAYREILNAVYAGRDYFELYVTFSRGSDSFRDDLLNVISRVNKIQSDHKLKVVFRAYNASATNNSLTIQLYYEEA